MKRTVTTIGRCFSRLVSAIVGLLERPLTLPGQEQIVLLQRQLSQKRAKKKGRNATGTPDNTRTVRTRPENWLEDVIDLT